MVRTSLTLLLGILAVYLLFFHRLDGRDLWNSHEARAAQDAQTILDDGCWLLPRLYDGRLELQKPPLYYWAVAVVAWCRGGQVDAWAVRFPSAIAALMCCVFVAVLGWLRGRPTAGVIAACVLATALHFTWIARVGRIDIPLTLTVTLTIGGFYLRQQGGSVGWAILAWFALALSILLKGPIGLVLPTAVCGLAFSWHASGSLARSASEGRPSLALRASGRLDLAWGVPLVALLVLPWFVWADRYTDGELTRVFLWRHNFARGFDEAGGLRAHPWWFYGPQFLLDFLPWSPLVLVAGWVAVRRGDWRTDSELRLGLIWFLVMFGLLSCVRFKRADYLLPAFPGAALLVGCAAERLYHTSVQPQRLAFGFAAVLVACLLAWGGYVDVVLPAQEAGREYTRFATAIRQVAPAPQPVLFFRTESHTLAFHVGRPLHVLVQWDDLERWTHQDSGFVVIPRRVVEELTAFPWAHRLEEVLDNVRLAGGRHEKPLVLFRLRPSRDDNPHDRSTPTAANPPRTDQRDPPGAE